MRPFALLWLAAVGLVAAQSPTPSTSGNQTAAVVTTTITSLVTPSPSGTPSPTTLVLTLTLNNAAQIANLSSTNGTSLNSTLSQNGTLTNATAVPWNSTDAWLPFKVVIDPAYGILGALLIISGVPVAALGGKNRWSSNAIVTGYCLMLFCLVLILHFGVEPSLQPPSPNPPSRTLRGLYLLAGVISAFFGGALGAFLYNLARHWVSAAGGFAFGWFLLATKKGGLINSVLGRWFLLGGLAVLCLVASLPKWATPHMLLLSTAWIGASAFTLGVDCYTRAGLKEFYMYNLGFHDLFPKLNGEKYPLTQTMIIELGILAAVVIMGAAIQFRVLNILQKRLREAREEEEARIDNEEVTKAAERFKNTETELDTWEKKHGNISSGTSEVDEGEDPKALGRSTILGDRSSTLLPNLGFEGLGDKRESLLSLVNDDRADRSGDYKRVPLSSPTGQGSNPGTPINATFHDRNTTPSPALTDADLESKLSLLAEVKKAREEVRSSLDRLRSSTPAGSVYSTAAMLDRSVTPASMLGPEDERARRISVASSKLLDRASPIQPPAQDRTPSEWERYVQERRLVTPSPTSGLLMPRSATLAEPSYRSSQHQPPGAFDRRERTQSLLEPGLSDLGTGVSGAVNGAHPATRRESRNQAAMLPPPMPRPSSYHDIRTGAPQLAPIITGSAVAAPRGPPSATRPGMQRTMTFEELAERHQKRMSRLQDPVTTQMTQQMEVEKARAKWELQQKREKEQMRAREAARMAVGSQGADEGTAGNAPASFASALDAQAGKRERQDPAKKADEWRRSVVSNLHVAGGSAGASGKRSDDERGKRSTGSHLVN